MLDKRKASQFKRTKKMSDKSDVFVGIYRNKIVGYVHFDAVTGDFSPYFTSTKFGDIYPHLYKAL